MEGSSDCGSNYLKVISALQGENEMPLAKFSSEVPQHCHHLSKAGDAYLHRGYAVCPMRVEASGNEYKLGLESSGYRN